MKISTEPKDVDPLFHYLVNRIIDDLKQAFVKSLGELQPVIESENVEFHSMDLIVSGLVSGVATLVRTISDGIDDGIDDGVIFLNIFEEGLQLALKKVRESLKKNAV